MQGGVAAGAEALSKYDVVGPAGYAIKTIAEIQSINPDTAFHYAFWPRAYLGYLQRDPCEQSMGIPFNYTGPASGGCSEFAGHWLYMTGTTLSAAVGAADLTLYVADASKLDPGRYAVLYDPPAASFANAEHVKVLSVDKSVVPNKVVLQSRGYKSIAQGHPKGAIIAEHDTGQGRDVRNWGWNLSQSFPKDANGKTTAAFMAEWLRDNVNRDYSGALVPDARVDGIYFDVDNYWIGSGGWDVDNDLIQDNGMESGGYNLWGEGLLDFYAILRSKLPDIRIVGGARRARGFESLDGIQMEGWPIGGNYYAADPAYEGPEGFDAIMQRMTVHMRHHNTREPYTENLNKVPTKVYPRGTPGLTSNAPFRFSFGSSLLDDVHNAYENSTEHPDPWWDEFAVDVAPGSPTYGYAIASDPANEAMVRAHKNWLGKPLGFRERIYDSALFAPEKNLISDGGVESGIGGWRTRNVAISRCEDTVAEGSFALQVSKHLSYDPNTGSTSVQGPAFRVVKGVDYTFAFAAKSSKMRDMTVSVANARANYLIPDQWTRIVRTFTANATGEFRPMFLLGKESTDVWLDGVYLFEGNANLFWREFEHGAVVVNATSKPAVVNLGEEFLRIFGTGQDPINDGSRIASVSVDPWDAAILVRPDKPKPRESLGAPTYEPAGQIATLLWEDAETGRWHLRVTGGTSSSLLSFFGRIDGVAAGDVLPVRCEGKDRITQVGDTLSYQLNVVARGEDGIDFTVAPGTEPCLDLGGSPSVDLNGAQTADVLLGKDGIPVKGPLNLATLKTCTPSR